MNNVEQTKGQKKMNGKRIATITGAFIAGYLVSVVVQVLL